MDYINNISYIGSNDDNQQQLFNGTSTTRRKQNEHSVNVSIEPNHEFEIQEIKYDGEEIFKE